MYSSVKRNTVIISQLLQFLSKLNYQKIIEPGQVGHLQPGQVGHMANKVKMSKNLKKSNIIPFYFLLHRCAKLCKILDKLDDFRPFRSER